MMKWYPDFEFTDAGIYYNDFNAMFYIRARMRKRGSNEDRKNRTSERRTMAGMYDDGGFTDCGCGHGADLFDYV